MPYIAYKTKRFSTATMAILANAHDIIGEYAADGYILTLRQLYYQFVARDTFPSERKWTWTGSRWKRDVKGTKNAPPNYTWLGKVISDGRNAGLIDWDSIEDRTRNVEVNSHWDSTADILEAVAKQFRYDLWEDQPNRVEVWIEKEALSGVFAGICEKLDVPLLACRGYVSQSEMWNAGRRFREHIKRKQKPIVLHFGDHDPSGIDMTRDNGDRLSMYAEGDVTVDRLALNMAQVKKYGPPPNPAKVTDSRFADYAAKYGDDSWELDALEPAVLTELVGRAVRKYRDSSLWERATIRQIDARNELQELADNRRQG